MRETDFRFVQDLLRREAGLVFDAGKAYLAELRLSTLARELGLETVEILLQRLRTGGEELSRRVVEALLVHETRFFRDENSFELLRRWILPQLVERAGRTGTLGFWSAGCASGQEPYSIAMVLKEELPAGMRARILATDYSSRALDRARGATYNASEVSRGLPEENRRRYFAPLDNGDWRAAPELRRMVEFRDLNLARAWEPLLPMDVVFLRNVLIYFDPAAKSHVLAGVKKALRPGGFLFLGGTEATMAIDPDFRRYEMGRSWCYQVTEVPARRAA